jgi:uncharacterized membrane protein YciS (DUF1049 family)
MTKSKRKLPVIIGVIFIVGFIIVMVLTTTGTAKFRCEVCMAYRGQTVCRNGAATTRQEAQRIATESACSDLGAGGFSNCRNGEPVSVSWK